MTDTPTKLEAIEPVLPSLRRAPYLKVLTDAITLGHWRRVVVLAFADAVGLKYDFATNTLVPDPKSSARGRNLARTWLAAYLLGRPPEYIALAVHDDNPLANLSDDQLSKLLDLIKATQALAEGMEMEGHEVIEGEYVDAPAEYDGGRSDAIEGGG